MLKKKLGIISTILSISLLFAPGVSQALPFASPAAPEDAAPRLLDKLDHWLDLLSLRAGGRRTHAPAPRAWSQPKNGCGIDPQGQPCNPGNNPPPPGNGG
ncbi:MAG TPA: hypothetical protein VF173_01980 [Thermoanaerobaculia bacterium]|nr:hypothetical protein [Thermoanaerobaculia bacterium]